MPRDLRKTLENLKVDQLRTHARELQIDRLSSLTTKKLLVDAIMECDSPAIQNRLKMTWIDNHRLGVILAIVGIALTLLFGIATFPAWSARNDDIQTVNEYGWINISVGRRNAIQNAEFERWLAKTYDFTSRYETDTKPTNDEYNSFITDFTAFAERNFTQAQIHWFNHAFGSGCGIKGTANIDQLEKPMREQVSQLGLIEWYLKDFIKFNLKNEEPSGPSML